MTHGIVTKTGNSYAIRVPKSYIEKNGLKLGDVVPLDDPLARQQKALDKLVKYAKTTGPIAGIKDPVKWQREIRKSDSPWDTIRNDTA